MKSIVTLAALSTLPSAIAQAPIWGQCGVRHDTFCYPKRLANTFFRAQIGQAQRLVSLVQHVHFSIAGFLVSLGLFAANDLNSHFRMHPVRNN